MPRASVFDRHKLYMEIEKAAEPALRRIKQSLLLAEKIASTGYRVRLGYSPMVVQSSKDMIRFCRACVVAVQSLMKCVLSPFEGTAVKHYNQFVKAMELASRMAPRASVSYRVDVEHIGFFMAKVAEIGKRVEGMLKR